MRGWNPTPGWTSDNICHLRPDSLTSPWHHLAQSGEKTDHLPPSSPGPALRWLFYYKHFHRWYNQTETCNYPYFVFLLYLWSRKFLICLKQDLQSEEGRDLTRSRPDPLSQEGPISVPLIWRQMLFQVEVKQLRTLSILSVGVYKEVQTDRNIFVFIFTLLWRCNFFKPRRPIWCKMDLQCWLGGGFSDIIYI